MELLWSPGEQTVSKQRIGSAAERDLGATLVASNRTRTSSYLVPKHHGASKAAHTFIQRHFNVAMDFDFTHFCIQIISDDAVDKHVNENVLRNVRSSVSREHSLSLTWSGLVMMLR